DAKGDDGEEEPLDPVPEQLNGAAVKGEAVAVHNGVLGLPAIYHAHGPGIADAAGAYGDERAQQPPADQLQQAAVKIRVVHERSLLFVWCLSAFVCRRFKCSILATDCQSSRGKGRAANNKKSPQAFDRLRRFGARDVSPIVV